MSKQKSLEQQLREAMQDEGFPEWDNYPESSNSKPFKEILSGKGAGMEMDIYWPQFRVGIEINGGQWSKGDMGHNSGAGVERDARKSNYCILYDIALLTFVTDHIEKQMQGYTLPTIRKVLILRGADLVDYDEEFDKVFNQNPKELT